MLGGDYCAVKPPDHLRLPEAPLHTESVRQRRAVVVDVTFRHVVLHGQHDVLLLDDLSSEHRVELGLAPTHVAEKVRRQDQDALTGFSKSTLD